MCLSMRDAAVMLWIVCGISVVWDISACICLTCDPAACYWLIGPKNIKQNERKDRMTVSSDFTSWLDKGMTVSMAQTGMPSF